MFVPKMWFDEFERIGMQRCTPFGYALKAVGEVVGFAGLLLLVAMPVYLMQQAIVGAFSWPLLWLLGLPFIVGFTGSAIVSFSWSVASRKQFRYDYESRVSSWTEAGEKRTAARADLADAARLLRRLLYTSRSEGRAPLG